MHASAEVTHLIGGYGLGKDKRASYFIILFPIILCFNNFIILLQASKTQKLFHI